ncbi:MAG: DNA replication and repair protein RecF [Patescibacteria group bacterium]|nr:DNA replication and repair protein RecF [Patescibacteria group bacterium]
MYLRRLVLQNFRNHKSFEFEFNSNCALIVGPNTSGKTNLVEAVFFLSVGRSFKAEKDGELVNFDESIARIRAEVSPSQSLETEDLTKLEVVIQNLNGERTGNKRYSVNGVSKRRIDFAGNLPCVLFSPVDLDIIVDSPGLRRKFLDDTLEQVDREYRNALVTYSKGLRQRNALLDKIKESGIRYEKQLEYWDSLLIENGEIITKKREDFITFVNNFTKDIFDFVAFYDKSIISKSRLLQYKDAEVGAGVTLVGPHRDDISFHMYNNTRQTTHDLKSFGSRGQQRLTILQLKLAEMAFIEKMIGERPILLLDDIFSELDQGHIKLVLEVLKGQQSIVTATHKEFFDSHFLKNADVLELQLRK